ncbi:hypothetical protein [Haloarchaeobius sp. HRN-SO-5]|uniref:hypothetical protein n=1 Tax=Haloarchaeobius sp. HRN-SO-5 TaxID=3446118 RepID=UPI003EB70064
MAFDTGWDLPSTAAVSFDPPVEAAGVASADAFRSAYGPFFRSVLATNLDTTLDEGALTGVANRLGQVTWRSSFERFERPADAAELDDLTRVVQAYARAGGAMRPTRRPGYWRHEHSREAAVDCTADCEDCEARSLPVTADSATLYRLCEPHHREVYRSYVEATRRDPDPPHDDEAFDLAERLDREALATDAASRLAEVAAHDPHRVRPVSSTLVDEFEAQRGAHLVSVDYLRAVTTALTHLATIDGTVRQLLVRGLGDEDETIRGASAAAVASLAWERPDALLDVDEASLGGAADERRPPVVRRLGAMLDGDEARSSIQALSALCEFARTHPRHVEPFGDTLRAGTERENPRVRFLAGATLATLVRADPDAGARWQATFERLAGEDGHAAAAGVTGLCYLAAADHDVGRDRAASAGAVRTYADPTRRPHGVVREATFALGHLGGPGDVEHVEWVESCARTDALRDACERTRNRLYAT